MKLLLLSALAFLPYAEDRRVTYFNDGDFARTAYHWFYENTGEPTRLYLNGALQSEQAGGTNDIRLKAAVQLQPTGLPVGVIDTAAGHGYRVRAVAELVAGNSAVLSSNANLTPGTISQSISNFVDAGFRILVLTIAAGDTALVSNACQYVALSNGLIFCAVPNVPVNIDESPDYPSAWANICPAIVPVAMTDFNGDLVAGATAWGSNVLAAPGWHIVASYDGQTNYSSGSSYAAPIMAGCVARFMARYPNQTSAAYRQALTKACTPILNSSRIDALTLLHIPDAADIIITPTIATVTGLSEWNYAVQYSANLFTWQAFTNRHGGESFTPFPGYFRVRP